MKDWSLLCLTFPRAPLTGRRIFNLSSNSHAPTLLRACRGKLDGLELKPDGVTGSTSSLFAMGFRNPFSMACDESSGLPVVGENGRDSNDQVIVVTAGSNHEWPISVTRNLLSTPLFDTGRVTIAPTGVAVRQGKAGKEIIVGGFKSGGVYLLRVGGDGRMVGGPVLLHTFDYGVVSLALDQHGCIIVADPFSISRLEEDGCR